MMPKIIELDRVPPEYFIAKIRTEINGERLPQKILKRLS